MPWQWDHDNYSGNNYDMIGYFYPEDINTIIQIRQMESKREKREWEDAKRKK